MSQYVSKTDVPPREPPMKYSLALDLRMGGQQLEGKERVSRVRAHVNLSLVVGCTVNAAG